MADGQEEKVTRLERDVWVSAFGWSAAHGHINPGYWAACAVLRLRAASAPVPVPHGDPDGRPRPGVEFVAALWSAVRAHEDGEEAPRWCGDCHAPLNNAAQDLRPAVASGRCPGCRVASGHSHAMGCEFA